jgi:peptidoglycan hydrolase-like protein with peptidoglycan-binding domain
MKSIRYSLAIPLIVFSICTFCKAIDLSWCQQQTFIVTAYYSPQAGQLFYTQENLDAEEILQWSGIAGACGKTVFNGMLAGPRTYPFGAMIYFSWLGLGEIADRGGAIVPAGERGHAYDRIDIRMGKGEEWLIRALTFGKKTLTGYYCQSGIQNVQDSDLGFDWSTIPTYKWFFDLSLRVLNLSSWRNDIRTWELQDYLIKLWYMAKNKQTCVYDKATIKAVCTYQTLRWISSPKRSDCGVFGPTTRWTMKNEVIQKWLLSSGVRDTTTFDALHAYALSARASATLATWSSSSSSAIIWKKSSAIFLFYRSYKKGDQNGEIKKLQSFLLSQWLYTGKIDGVYSAKTMFAVYAFQKKYNLISDIDSPALEGYLGPKTRDKINELLLK